MHGKPTKPLEAFNEPVSVENEAEEFKSRALSTRCYRAVSEHNKRTRNMKFNHTQVLFLCHNRTL